jgi:hypothetical protein
MIFFLHISDNRTIKSRKLKRSSKTRKTLSGPWKRIETSQVPPTFPRGHNPVSWWFDVTYAMWILVWYWSYIVRICIFINLASNILLLASKKCFLTSQGLVGAGMYCRALLFVGNVLVMEIGWTDVGSGGYILVSCAHSNTSLMSEADNK